VLFYKKHVSFIQLARPGTTCKKSANKKVVMLGEASHGTHEYYTWRTTISKKLIEEHGFSFIAVEGDN
jgi:erythromycin esterase-like protein